MKFRHVLLVTAAALSLAVADPNYAEAGYRGGSCSQTGAFVKGQPVLNVLRFVTGANRRARRAANHNAGCSRGDGLFVQGQPVRNVLRFVTGANRRARRACR